MLFFLYNILDVIIELLKKKLHTDIYRKKIRQQDGKIKSNEYFLYNDYINEL